MMATIMTIMGIGLAVRVMTMVMNMWLAPYMTAITEIVKTFFSCL